MLGEEIYKNAMEFERKLWCREDYQDDDVVLFSHIMDYVEKNKEDFCNYMESKK